jgi:hypothetical protein
MDSIRSAIERASDYLTEHPEAATASDSVATAVREDGLRFRLEGPWASLTSDMAESVGGGASATGTTEGQLRAIVERAESRSAVRDALVRKVSMTTEIATG